MSATLRYALRALVRTPSVTVPAAASLALAIAVNTTMFSVANAVLFRPLGGPGVGELVRIGRSHRGDQSFRAATLEEFADLRLHASTIASLAGHQIEGVSVGTPQGVQPASAEIVTASYFSVLGVRLQSGRDFGLAEELSGGGPPVAIVSDRFWHRHFARDPGAVGRTLSLNGHELPIVGVAAAGFAGTFPGVDVDLWVPVTAADLVSSQVPREPPALMLIGRLTPGASIDAARAELNVIAQRRAGENPSRNRDRGFVVGSSRGAHPALARAATAFVALLMGVVGVVLLLACANVASLLLARATARHGELALRLALGAGRRRLVGQLLVESGALALLGGLGGLSLSLVALWLINGLSLAVGPTGTPIFLDLQLDMRVLAFTAAVTILTTFAFGLMPALQATRVDLISLLKDSRAVLGGGRSRLRGALLVLQVALSCVLLIAAGLLFRSLRNAAGVDVGFDPDRVVVTAFTLQSFGSDRARIDRFLDEVLRRARALPGVEHAALADFVPMAGRGSTLGVFLPGVAPTEQESRQRAAYNTVSDDYLATLGQPLLRGRDFARAGAPDATPVAIVNESMAQRLWPGREAIGQRFRLEGEPGFREVIGVVRDAMYASFGDTPGPFVYLPTAGRYAQQFTLHVRTTTDPVEMLGALRRVAAEIEPNALPHNARTLREAMGFSLVPARIAHGVFTIAGVIGLLLAVGGLYGLVCYTLARRLREIGIRVALGASRKHVLRVIVGGAVRLTVIGVVVGIALAAAGTRVLSVFLYGLSPTDPVTFAGIAGLLILVTLAAGYAAARRGLSLDPIAALRQE